MLGYVKGYKIPFNCSVVQNREPTEPSFSLDEILHINLELNKLLLAGAIIKCEDVPGQFISNIFLTPKSDGTFRFILNLKKLNKFVITHHFKMEDIRTVSKLISKNDFMANIDLKEAYFFIPIHSSSKKFLRFKFHNQTYEFQCLPFGLSSAPYVFTKLMRPVTTFLRNRGHLMVIYLDDILSIDNTYEGCSKKANEIITLLEKLGFMINYTKSDIEPNQRKVFLGFETDSKEMALKLPLVKRQKILNLVNRISTKYSITIREFAKFLGLLTSACPAVDYGWLYTKQFEREKFLALQQANDDYDKIMKLNSNLQPSFIWWRDHIMKSMKPFRSNEYTLEIFSDASLTGWGIACNREKSNGFWSETERQDHINLLELRAAFIGLKCFANGLHNKEILLRIDNMTAIAYINRMGGVQYEHLNDITLQIWQWCEERKIFIFASYIKSKDNIDADRESRRTNIDTEWELSSMAFYKITKTFGFPEIDLFASRLNAKCSLYVSWKRDPNAYNIDAFTLNWKNYFFYCFPPFSLILKCLRKIINDQASGIIVVPYWPSQAWYPLFLELQCSDPIYFPPSYDLLHSPFSTQHPLWRSLTLVSCHLSGKRLHTNV